MSEPRREVLADGVDVWLGNCGEVLSRIGRVDAIVTDPPYGLGEHSAKKRASRGRLGPITEYVDSSDWDNDAPTADDIAGLRAISDYQIIFGGNYFEGLGPTSCWLVWDKLNGSSDFADCELAWTNLPKAVRRIRWLWNGMLRAEKGARVHPTQKPVGVMKWCIEHLPPLVETICDPYLGSGTTGVAAVAVGKRFIGIERERGYFDIACSRIAEAIRQPSFLIEQPIPAVKQEAFL